MAASTQDAMHPLEDIRRVAEATVQAEVPSAGGRLITQAEGLDPRLRLPRCAQAPVGQLAPTPNITARVSVGVSCVSPRWQVYVPVRVESEIPVLVLQQAMARGAAVTAQDVEVRTQRVPGLATLYIGDAAQLAGRHLKRAVPAGTALTADLMANDVLVRRGQRVTLLASVGGIEVRAQGEAIQDASANGRVRVLNLNSRRVVEGQVESRDVVRVSL